MLDLRMTVKMMQDKEGAKFHRFKANVPGEDGHARSLEDKTKNPLCQDRFIFPVIGKEP